MSRRKTVKRSPFATVTMTAIRRDSLHRVTRRVSGPGIQLASASATLQVLGFLAMRPQRRRPRSPRKSAGDGKQPRRTLELTRSGKKRQWARSQLGRTENGREARVASASDPGAARAGEKGAGAGSAAVKESAHEAAVTGAAIGAARRRSAIATRTVTAAGTVAATEERTGARGAESAAKKTVPTGEVSPSSLELQPKTLPQPQVTSLRQCVRALTRCHTMWLQFSDSKRRLWRI